LSLATSEFGISSRRRHPKFGSFFSPFWVRFPNAPCVFNNILASFVLFLCFSESCLPGSLAKFRGREIDESESPETAHRLPKLRPEKWGRRLASQLLDSLTPRLLDCTWRQKPQAGTTDENKRGRITYPTGPDPCPTPRNNSSLCRPVCQGKNAQSTKSPTSSRKPPCASPQWQKMARRHRRNFATTTPVCQSTFHALSHPTDPYRPLSGAPRDSHPSSESKWQPKAQPQETTLSLPGRPSSPSRQRDFPTRYEGYGIVGRTLEAMKHHGHRGAG